MATTLKAGHAPRYAELARLLLRHREAARFSSDSELPAGGEADAPGANGSGSSSGAGRPGRRGGPGDAEAEQLAAELESLGPTFVKLGQLLSTRSDLLPPVYLDRLARLQDKVEPFPTEKARNVVEDELGVRLSRAFGEFGERPIASASLGQVYKASLRDGREVAVKVQRPGIGDQVLDDMDVVNELAAFLDGHSDVGRRLGFAAMAERFRRGLLNELDYRREAENLALFHEQLSGYRRLVIPLPIGDFCTSRVLTMEFVAGRNIGSLGPLAQLELDGADLADELFKAYLDQIFVHGFFHADPHPGNVLLTPDGRLGLIDLGMVSRVEPGIQDSLLRLLLAASENEGSQVATQLAELGERLDDYDEATFSRRVSELVLRRSGASMSDLQAGRLISELAAVSAAAGLRPPVELTMLGKALLNLDEVARVLDADFQPVSTIRAHAARLMRHRMLRAASPGHLLTAALDAKDFTEQLPSRLNKVLDALAAGTFTLNVEGVDERQIMKGVQKLANRSATGVVIAALVLAAAIFAVAGTGVGGKLWGYPVITIVLLFVAAVAALWLIFGIVRSDLPQRSGDGEKRFLRPR